MEYAVRSGNKRWGLPLGMLAIILGLLVWGTASPTESFAATIVCGQCHSIPPQDSDNGGCKQVSKSHPAHAVSQSDCSRCHPVPTGSGLPSATHDNNIVNITSVVSPGLSYSTVNGTCTNACHRNEPNPVWGGSPTDCNLCHFRKGAVGGYTMSGLHVDPARAFKHYSSAIKVVDNTQTVTCVNCHPNNDNDTVAPRQHIKESTLTAFPARANMSTAFQNVTVIGIGYTKGATQGTGTCAAACHSNSADTFGNYSVNFKPGVAKKIGAYQAPKWSDSDLSCNSCHSAPSQSATFSSETSGTYGASTTSASTNADNHHQAHMFKYKLSATNFPNADRNIYCSDCHKLPDMTSTRGFKDHSTTGQGGSGVISLPVKSQNARVYLLGRNSGIGRDGVTPPGFSATAASCSNIYCHTAISPTAKAQWSGQACNSCHGVKDGVETGTGAPGYINWTSNFITFEDYTGGGGAHYTHVNELGYSCRTCHYRGGPDNPANHHKYGSTVLRPNVLVNVEPKWWFKNNSSVYDKTTRTCSNVRCHYGTSKNWDCSPAH